MTPSTAYDLFGDKKKDSWLVDGGEDDFEMRCERCGVSKLLTTKWSFGSGIENVDGQ
jgi:hypothetical protein